MSAQNLGADWPLIIQLAVFYFLTFKEVSGSSSQSAGTSPGAF